VIHWFFTHWFFHFIIGCGFASWNWPTYNCLIHATFCSLLETTKSLVVVALGLGGVQVCIGCNVILFSWLPVVFILTSHISPLFVVVVAELVALILAGTVHRVCITTWYVTLIP
jgi:hypothetical protein